MDVIFWTGMFSNLSRPIGCYQLAHWTRKHGYDCQVIDFVHKMGPNELVKFTKQFITKNTLCIGISSTFWSEFRNGRSWPINGIPKVLKLALEQIKTEYPEIHFVLGGSQVDHQTRDTLELFDFVVSGAAEDIFLEYLDKLRKNKKSVFSFETRHGVPYKTGSLNNNFNFQENDHLFADQDCIIEGETLPIEISRGCIFKCSYCQYPYIGKKKLDYVRSTEYIKNELEYNYNKFKTKNYYILDDTFNDTSAKMDVWFDCVKSLDFKIEYTGYFRADLLSRNQYQLEKLKESGLASVFFGIESFHPTVSKIMGKGWSGKEGKKFLSQLKTQWKDDVTMHLSFIIGFPNETETDYRETQKWCLDTGIDSWVWQPLYINTESRLFSSELDRNPEKFGFTMLEDGKHWANSHHTKTSAVALALQLNSERDAFKTQKITSWPMLYMMSLGYESYSLKQHYAHDFSKMDRVLRERDFLTAYKSKLSSITA